MYRLTLAMLACLSLPALAQTSAAPVPPPPVIADQGLPEPEVRITQDGDNMVEEYRLNGRVYMLKVSPKNAPAYYLMDKDGNGQMQRIDPAQRLIVPQWVLLRF